MNELKEKKESYSESSETNAWSFSLFSDSSTVLGSNVINDQEKNDGLVDNNNSKSVF